MLRSLRLGFTLLLIFASSTAHSVADIPSLSSPVMDGANMLAPTTAKQLVNVLEKHEASTSNQIVVFTVETLEGNAIAEYALEVGRHWKLGQKDVNNGILFLISKNEKKMRIEVGYGLEGDLPDARAKQIIQRIVRPAFKQGDFDKGVSDGVDAIIASIEGSYTAPEPSPSDKFSDILIPFGFISVFGLASILRGKVAKRTINTGVGGFFGGAFAAIATQTWYYVIPAALVMGFLASRSGSKREPSDSQNVNNPLNHNPGRHWGNSGGFGSGGGAGGGFSGGGGSFGGGGASGGW